MQDIKTKIPDEFKAETSPPQRHKLSRILFKNKRIEDDKQGRGVQCKLSIKELEEKFKELTLLFYTTKVKHKELDQKAMPYVDENVTFTDPWQTDSGIQVFWTQLKGFHSIIFFDFTILSLNVTLNENKQGGRVVVDGWMNLQQFKRIYTYPLRTILVYDFVITGEGKSFKITDLEEIWSFADLIEQIPIVGFFYNLFRWGAGYFFTFIFWLGTLFASLFREL
ncbi:hypothetical protein ABK040_013162 [Willaertia magna]